MPDASPPQPPKKEVALALLQGPSLYVHLDPRREGVMVPKWFTGQPELILELGLNMAIPILDLKVEDDAITCTLSFNRAPFWCRLPWTSIFALVGRDQRGMIWPDDIPPEVALRMQQKQSGAGDPKQQPQKKGRPKAVESLADRARKKDARLRLTEGADGAEGSEAREDETPSRRGDKQRRGLAPAPGETADKRPRLASVPNIEESEGAVARGASADDAPGKDEDTSAQKKPKRELPPYLRVIK